jgi:DNA-binding MarR family transcriptional regulator
MTAAPEAAGASAVEWQLSLTAEENGQDFDATVLALTLSLYRAVEAYDRAHVAELAPHRLNPGQFSVLTALHRAGQPVTMRELSEMVSVRPANLTSVVDALVERSLVDRRLNPGDRRSFLVTTTPAGEEFLMTFLTGHWPYLTSLTSGLTARQQQQLTRLLDQLRASIETNVRAGPAKEADPEQAGS